MKYLLIKFIRDIKANILLNISVLVVSFAAVFLFSGLNSTGRSIQRGVDKFYETQNLATYTVTRDISPENFKKLRGELDLDGAVVFDDVTLKVGDINRNISVSMFTYSDFTVNIPEVVEGEAPDESFEALIDVAFAGANGISPGDTFDIKVEGQPQSITISGLAIFPDHLFKGVAVPRIKENGIIKMFVDLPDDIALDTLYITTDMDKPELITKLYKLTGQSFATARILTRNENASVLRIKSDIGLINSLMNVVPMVCLIALCLILFVNMSKRVEDESYNIGVMCANGVSKPKICFALMMPYLLLVLVPGIIGAVLGALVLPEIYISLLSRFYTIPTPVGSGAGVTTLALAAVLIVAFASLFFAAMGVLRQTPSSLMKGRSKKSVRVFASAKLPVTFKLTVRNFLSYGKKSFFTVVSATLCLGLLFTAFLIDNSSDNLESTVYEKYYNYDFTLRWNTGDKIDYDDVAAAVTESGLFDNLMFCMEFPANHDGKNVIVSVIDGENPCYNLFDDKKKLDLDSYGVFVPESYGETESISLTMYAATSFVLELPVAGTYTDMGLLGVIVPMAALKRAAPLFEYYLKTSGINSVVYAKRIGDEEEVYDFCASLEDEFEAAFLTEEHSVDSGRYRQLFTVLYITEALLFIVCGLIMALLILNISCLSIKDRIKDYTVFKALGVDAGKVNMLSSLENYLSVAIAYILAFPTGAIITNMLLRVVRNMIGVVIYLKLYALSAVILFVAAALFTALSNIMINRKIKKVNIAYNLKIKE